MPGIRKANFSARDIAQRYFQLLGWYPLVPITYSITPGAMMIYATTKGSREKLVRDLQRIVSDADDMLKDMANTTAEDFAAVRERIEEKLADARARLDEAQIVVTEKACGVAHVTRQYIRENPWKLVGIAAVTALVATALIKRR